MDSLMDITQLIMHGVTYDFWVPVCRRRAFGFAADLYIINATNDDIQSFVRNAAAALASCSLEWFASPGPVISSHFVSPHCSYLFIFEMT